MTGSGEGGLVDELSKGGATSRAKGQNSDSTHGGGGEFKKTRTGRIAPRNASKEGGNEEEEERLLKSRSQSIGSTAIHAKEERQITRRTQSKAAT
jgi:hypothetical protein